MIKNVPDLDCFTPKHEYRGVRVFDAPTFDTSSPP